MREVIDYALIEPRWRNAVRYVDISRCQCSVISLPNEKINMQVRLTAKDEEGPVRNNVRKYKKATEAVRGDVNATLSAREDWEEGARGKLGA